MITRMEITYKSKEKCNIKPNIFSSGGYGITLPDKRSLNFDFEDMNADVRFENDGYLYIDCQQRNFDESMLGMTMAEADEILRSTKKEDFTEIFYESYITDEDGDSIELIPLDVTFYDWSKDGDGSPMPVPGEAFSNLR